MRTSILLHVPLPSPSILICKIPHQKSLAGETFVLSKFISQFQLFNHAPLSLLSFCPPTRDRRREFPYIFKTKGRECTPSWRKYFARHRQLWEGETVPASFLPRFYNMYRSHKGTIFLLFHLFFPSPFLRKSFVSILAESSIHREANWKTFLSQNYFSYHFWSEKAYKQ